MKRPLWVLAWLSLLKIAVHVLTNGRYGYFRDELYYIACSSHLAWGYVDQPPLSLAILALVRAIAGDSMIAIRLSAIPALVEPEWLRILSVSRDLRGSR